MIIHSCLSFFIYCFPPNLSLQIAVCYSVMVLNKGIGCLIPVDLAVKAKNTLENALSFWLKKRPRVASCSVLSKPRRKQILALVEGM